MQPFQEAIFNAIPASNKLVILAESFGLDKGDFFAKPPKKADFNIFPTPDYKVIIYTDSDPTSAKGQKFAQLLALLGIPYTPAAEQDYDSSVANEVMQHIKGKNAVKIFDDDINDPKFNAMVNKALEKRLRELDARQR